MKYSFSIQSLLAGPLTRINPDPMSCIEIVTKHDNDEDDDNGGDFDDVDNDADDDDRAT